MAEVTLIRCAGCGTPLGRDPPNAAVMEHVASCPEHPLAKRLAAEVALADRLVETLIAVVDEQGIDHVDEDCPQDDTCDCPLVARVNAALAAHQERRRG